MQSASYVDVVSEIHLLWCQSISFSWSSGSHQLDEVAFLEVSVRLITPLWCRVWSPPEADDSSQMGACEDAVSATYLQGFPWGHCVHWDAFHCSDPRKKGTYWLLSSKSPGSSWLQMWVCGAWFLSSLNFSPWPHAIGFLHQLSWWQEQSPPSLLPSSIASNKRVFLL